MLKIIDKIVLSPLVVIVLAAGMRLLPHEPNVAPIGALALFGGAYLSRKQALVVPVLAMLISDYFIGFHSLMVWVYGSFLITVMLGYWLRSDLEWKNILVASALSSTFFFVITNFGVWFAGTMYPRTLAGLVDCYVMGLPFFRNTLVGDFGYNLIFFGGYALVTTWLRGWHWAKSSS